MSAIMQSSHSESGGSVSSSTKFPLPRDHFPQVNVSFEQQGEYRALVRRRVDALLEEEERQASRRAGHEPRLAPTDWKFVRSHNEVKMYRRRRRSRKGAAPVVEPNVVALGRVAGSIEDVLYGSFSTTQEEMQTTMAYTHEPTDCALLRVLELDAPDDPLHYLGLEWMLSKMPFKAIVTPRDLCYLNGMGVETDEHGQKFGYVVLESVELPECPPFERRRSDVIRGELYVAALFRETTPGFVSVMIRGRFNLSGDLPRQAGPLVSMAFIAAMLRAVDGSEAKKLTLLARHNAVSGYNCDAINQDEAFDKNDVCSVCIKKNKGRLFSAVRLRACKVCGVAICSKCSAKNKRLFLGSQRPCAFAVCCPSCVSEAQQMTGMQPCQEEYGVVADFYLHGPALESYSGALDAALAQHEYMSTLSVSEVDESEWWGGDSAETISIPEALREKSPTERATSGTIDESWVGRDFMDGYALDGSSADEEDDFTLEVDQPESWIERPYEEEIEVNVTSTSDALAALLKRAAVIGNQVQQTDSALRELQRTRVQSQRLRLS